MVRLVLSVLLDLVLLQSFSSITIAIQRGRLVFDNLQKTILYVGILPESPILRVLIDSVFQLLPAGSFSELIPVLLNCLLGLPQVLSNLQMSTAKIIYTKVVFASEQLIRSYYLRGYGCLASTLPSPRETGSRSIIPTTAEPKDGPPRHLAFAPARVRLSRTH